MIKAPKKLIEVALPLDDINDASAKEKTIRQGHPSSLHMWWARRPLAAARAVLFAQLVNDPGGERGWGNYPGQTVEDANKEREKLFEIIRKLLDWDNINNSEIVELARSEIYKSWEETCRLNGIDDSEIPEFHDPFCGGGAIPLEAQRLGLKPHASDINPIPLLINELILRYIPMFNGSDSLLHPSKMDTGKIHGLHGIVLDYQTAAKKIEETVLAKAKSVYPNVIITKEISEHNPELKDYVGQSLKIMALIWARTVKSPSPAHSDIYVPLVSSFQICKKKNNEHYVAVNFDSSGNYDFVVKKGKCPESLQSSIGRKGGTCIVSNTSIPLKYIRNEGRNGRIGKKLMCVVLATKNKRVYLSPKFYQQNISECELELNDFELNISYMPRDIKTHTYGMERFSQLFTTRQLFVLKCFSEEIKDKTEKLFGNDKQRRNMIAILLSFSLDKLADLNNSLCRWEPLAQCPRQLFSRQAIPMVWDFAEANPFSGSSGSWQVIVRGISNSLLKNFNVAYDQKTGQIDQADATAQDISKKKIISTDPPYYDNIMYSDLSDFFYMFLRKTLRSYYPDWFMSISTPKKEELVANPYRDTNKSTPEKYFIEGMEKAINNLHRKASDFYPITIYYAFKQSETKGDSTFSVGWETFLSSVIESGYSITGTWPLRTENSSRMLGQNKNALASSIVLSCRKRSKVDKSFTRKDFLRELKESLPKSLEIMIGGRGAKSPIAPVDLAQAAIGPGMAIFSQYESILNSDGSKMSVHDALIQINKIIDEFFNEAEGDMDSDTRFCIDWFMQYGFKQAEYGQADVLARAKGTTVEGLAVAGVVETGGGKVRLLKFEDYPENWDPERDTRTPTWEALHQLIRALRSGGEAEAGLLLKKMAERTESIRQLAYRLYTLCERKGWAEEARAYNELIASWHGTIEAAAQSQAKSRQAKQLTLDI